MWEGAHVQCISTGGYSDELTRGRRYIVLHYDVNDCDCGSCSDQVCVTDLRHESSDWFPAKLFKVVAPKIKRKLPKWF